MTRALAPGRIALGHITPGRSVRGKLRALVRLWRGFARCSSGAAAAEFAVVGPVFIVLLIAMIQTGIAFFMQQVLIEATAQASRLIMTGQAQTSSMDASTFLDTVAADAGGVLDRAKLSAVVQTFDTFSAITPSDPVENGAMPSQGNLPFSLGGPSAILLVQVFYQLPVVTEPFGFNLATLGHNALLMATAVFSNEPY